MALLILSDTWPKMSPKTLAYLAAHLTDKDNTPADTGHIACMLFRPGSDSSDSIKSDVIAVVRKQNKQETVEALLQCFHVYPTKNADALSFIGSSLDSPEVWIRRLAVEAVTALPLGERSHFLTQLERLRKDPNEPAEIRSAAAKALK